MTLNLIITHNAKKIKISPSEDATWSFLTKEIMKETLIPTSLQKLILKGKVVSAEDDKPLSELFGTGNLRLTLVGSKMNDVVGCVNRGPTPIRITPSMRRVDRVSSEQTPSTPTWEHESIVQKVQPLFEKAHASEDFVKGVNGKSSPLPKSLSNIFDSKGELIRFTFSVEKRRFTIQRVDEENETPRSVSFDDVRDIRVEGIPKQEDYSALGVQIGSNPLTDVEWFFFVPSQFVKAIRYTLLGNLSFPFLHSE